MAENHDTGPLPPGWDRKYDHRTGRYYYVNYFNKSTTWEDPRQRYRQLAQVVPQHVAGSVIESIPMQHGSPDLRGYHIYPSNSSHYQPQPAFQNPAPYTHTSVHFQDLSNVRPSPIPNRVASHLGGGHGSPYASPVRSAETSLTTETEQSVAKISAMFPTVTETHIRTLLMKYLKSVFPKAEETLLLDILSSSDNNVQKATEKLLAMGFEKRDTPPPRLTLRRKEEEQKALERRSATPTPPPRMKSLEEKQKMKVRLQEQYEDIPERVITIALESVDYDEERAGQILELMVLEETKAKTIEPSTSVMSSQSVETRHSSPQTTMEVVTSSAGASPARKSLSPRKTASDVQAQPNRRSKGKKDVPKVSRGTSTTEDNEYKSPYVMKTRGPTREHCNGPNDELLLVEYVAWNGPNPELLGNSIKSGLANGPDKSLLQGCSYLAKGANSDLRKGPMWGLAKGSIYSQLACTSPSESRGK